MSEVVELVQTNAAALASEAIDLGAIQDSLESKRSCPPAC
jgi:hypothetical protein